MSDVAVSTSGPAPEASKFSFDQLDSLVRVTTIQGWLYLSTLFVVFAAAIIFAVVYEVPRKVNGEGILLTEHDTLSHVRAEATGRLVELRVKLGDSIKPGQEIGQISQNDLSDTISEAESRLDELKREDRELTEFEEKERQRKETAVAEVKQAILQAQDNASDKLQIAHGLVTSTDRLRQQKHVGDHDVLEARQKYYEIWDALYKGKSRLAELALEVVTAESTRRRMQLERRLKIRAVETKVDLDRKKWNRTSRLVSQSSGRVAQVLTAPGELVHEGSPIVLLHAPKEKHGTDDAGPAYDSIVFVPAGEGKKIEIDHAVEVSPATVKREEHGYIKGKVVAVSELPATKLAMEAALAHPELVDSFLKRYSPGVLLRLHIKLDEIEPRPDKRNHFLWSSSSGADQPLKTGTMCQAAVVVGSRKMISLILPWTKTLLGAE
jgi:HlyD family secretion protein